MTPTLGRKEPVNLAPNAARIFITVMFADYKVKKGNETATEPPEMD